MRGFQTCCLILLATISTVRSFCQEVSHNGCRADNRHPEFLNHEVCQKLCQTYNLAGQCQYYRFNNNVGQNDCFVYGDPMSYYVDGCDIISAPRNIDETCFNPPEDSCFMTQSSECAHNLGSLLESFVGKSPNKEFCKQQCQIDPKCQRWIFNKQSETCTTLSDATQDCKEEFGPPNKSPQDCGEAPPAPTTQSPDVTTVTADYCKADTVDFFPDDDDCMSFYQCVEGSVTHPRCPDCDYYDTESKFCKQPINGEVKCGSRPYDNTCKATPHDGECPSDYGYFPVTDNCKQYKICDNGVATYMTCPTQSDNDGIVQQLLYNGDQIQCDWTYRVGCGSRPVCDSAGNCQCQLSVPANPNSPCQGIPGIQIIADPFDCQNQLVCKDGSVLEQIPCPSDQFYEISTASCKSDESVCNGNDQYRPICVDGGTGSKQQCRCV